MTKYIWHDGFKGVEQKAAEVKPNFIKLLRQKLKRFWNKVRGRKAPVVISINTEPKILGDCCSLLDNPAIKPAEQVWDDPETATNINFVRPDLRYLASDRLDKQGYWTGRKRELVNGLEEKIKAKSEVTVSANE